MAQNKSILREVLCNSTNIVTLANGRQVQFSNPSREPAKKPARILVDDPSFLSAIDPTSVYPVQQNNTHSRAFSGHCINRWTNNSTSQIDYFNKNDTNPSTNRMPNNSALAVLASQAEINNKTINQNGQVNTLNKTVNSTGNGCLSYNKWLATCQIRNNGLPKLDIPIVTDLMVTSYGQNIQNGQEIEIKAAGLTENPLSSSTQQLNLKPLILKIPKSKLVSSNKRQRYCDKPFSSTFSSNEDYEFPTTGNQNKQARKRNLHSNKTSNETNDSREVLGSNGNIKNLANEAGNSLADQSVTAEVIIETDRNPSKKLTLFKSSPPPIFKQDIISTILADVVLVTKLDLKVLTWKEIVSDQIKEHCLNVISELKNLEVLKLSARMFHFDVGQSTGELLSSITDYYSFENSAFLNITTECKNLKTLHITDDRFPKDKLVPEHILLFIKNCSKLENLKLENIPTLGQGVSLPQISEDCKQLKTLKLKNVGNLKKQVSNSAIETCLLNLNNCERLYISLKLEFSLKIISNLCQCSHLETLTLYKVDMKFSEATYFEKNLHKLDRLMSLNITLNGKGKFLSKLYSQMRKIKEENSLFELHLENDVYNSSQIAS